jgi:hypothetical protein
MRILRNGMTKPATRLSPVQDNMTASRHRNKFGLSSSDTLPLALLLAYLVRITIPAVWLSPLAPEVVNFTGYAVLAVTLVYLIWKSSLRVHPASMVLIACTGFSVFASEQPERALEKWLIWVLLLTVAGPLLAGLKVNRFHAKLWYWQRLLILFISLLSFIWYILKLPMYGKGMSGVTFHCMLLGPMAALAAISAFASALYNRSYVYGLLGAICALVCLLTGSRVALVGMLAGMAIGWLNHVRARPTVWILVIALSLCTISVWEISGYEKDLNWQESTLGDFSKEAYEKGSRNSRQELWDNRWYEFTSNPVFGVGFGTDTYSSTLTDYGTTVVEPGSSWLAVLSMTGISGALGIFAILYLVFHNVKTSWHRIPPMLKAEYLGTGVFWIIHGVAEGWVFAAGSILCLLFWTWVTQAVVLSYFSRASTESKDASHILPQTHRTVLSRPFARLSAK